MCNRKILFIPMMLLIGALLYGESLKVAAVQLEIHKSTYSSVGKFRADMESHVSGAVNAFHPDLIVFPEYTSVFTALIPYYDYLDDASTPEEILLRINGDNSGIRSVKDLFVSEAPAMGKILELWGDLARKYKVYIVGGSYFAWNDGKLTNRLIVFGPDGSLIYEQDKFFLTDFETDITELSPGSSAAPQGIEIRGKRIVFTICRDTFLERWEHMYDGADLWIDIKANGEPYGEEQVELFARALPARLEVSSARYGATVCLTGDFLNLLWEGESSFVGKTGEGVHTYIKAKNPKKSDILYFVVD